MLEMEMIDTADSEESVSFNLGTHENTRQLQIPAVPEIDITEVNDLRRRATEAERQLAAEGTKLAREKRKNRRLGTHVNEYVSALSQATQDLVQLNNQCHFLSTSNTVLFEEVRRLKLVVQTLEAVLQMFSPGDKTHDTTLGVVKSPEQ